MRTFCSDGVRSPVQGLFSQYTRKQRRFATFLAVAYVAVAISLWLLVTLEMGNATRGLLLAAMTMGLLLAQAAPSAAFVSRRTTASFIWCVVNSGFLITAALSALFLVAP